MSGIYIKGMEMPKRGEFSHVRIYDNGEVTIENNGIEYPVAKAVAVPDHGRLIDADALGERMHAYYGYSERLCGEIDDFIINAPTIIPAEESE